MCHREGMRVGLAWWHSLSRLCFLGCLAQAGKPVPPGGVLESLCHRVACWKAWEDEGNLRVALKGARAVGFGTLLCTVGF